MALAMNMAAATTALMPKTVRPRCVMDVATVAPRADCGAEDNTAFRSEGAAEGKDMVKKLDFVKGQGASARCLPRVAQP